MATSFSTGGYVASENFAGCFSRRMKSGARRGVLIHGGRGQTCLSNLPPDRITNGLTDDSVPVGYADYSDGKTWGNDTGSTRVGQAWTYQKSAFGAKSDKVCLYGSSMGAAPLLNWAIANVSSVACIVLLIGAVDIGDIYDNNRTSSLGFTASTDIDAAYGGAAAFATARASHNPVLNAAALSAIPILQLYSGNDPVCVPATQTAFQAAVGSSCTLVNMGNLGHAASTNLAYGDQVAGFLAKYA